MDSMVTMQGVVSTSVQKEPKQMGYVFPDDTTSKYTLDADNNILPPVQVFDGKRVCLLLKDKMKQPKMEWIRQVKDGVIMILTTEKENMIPPFISLIQAIDLVSSMIQASMGVFPCVGEIKFEAPVIEKTLPTAEQLALYAWSSDLLNELHKIVPEKEILLPNAPASRCNIRYIAIRIMTESMNWLEQAALSKDSTLFESKQDHDNAVESFLACCRILNRVSHFDLQVYDAYVMRLLSFSTPIPPANAFPVATPLVGEILDVPQPTASPCTLLWVDMLCKANYSNRFIPWVTQCVILAQRYDAQTITKQENIKIEGDTTPMETCQDETSISLWACVHEISTLFYHMCFLDHFVKQLVHDTRSDQILLAIESILRLNDKGKIHVTQAKYHFLRIFTVLAENEEPYFLDFISTIRASFVVAQLISTEASKILRSTPTSLVDPEVSLSCRTSREALRAAELLSYDSNFVKCITEHLTLSILEYLSVAPDAFKEYFQIEQSRYITALVFRMIANLHCYNPSVSPPDQKHFLINKIALFFSTIFAVDKDGNPTCTSRIIIGHIASNLWILFQLVTESFSFTMQELELWSSFVGELQKCLNFIFLPPSSTATTSSVPKPVVQPFIPSVPKPVLQAPPRTKDDEEYKTDSEVDDEEMEDDADEFVLTPAVKPATIQDSLPQGSVAIPIDLSGPPTEILNGLIVCLGEVPDPRAMKDLITRHGGQVLGYVTKSVTHVICGHNTECFQASASKIQSAVSKQVPAVSELLIHDSLAKGKILSEKPYLVASHSYVRRIQPR